MNKREPFSTAKTGKALTNFNPQQEYTKSAAAEAIEKHYLRVSSGHGRGCGGQMSPASGHR